MDATAAVAAVLRTINDHTVVRPYGDGLLVDLPMVYGDGDTVRVLVEPMGSGVRVSDRATAVTLLSMAGVDPNAGRAAEAVGETLRSTGINAVTAEPGEIATFGNLEDLGKLILDVAHTSLRIDQLRWLAVQQPPVRFVDQVTTRIKVWAGKGRQVRRDAPIPLRSGRRRTVTALVSNSEQEAYIQALSTRDRERAAEHCYHLFGLSNMPPARKIATLDGSIEAWPAEIISELQTVASVEFFADAGNLERRLDDVVPPPQRLLRA